MALVLARAEGGKGTEEGIAGPDGENAEIRSFQPIAGKNAGVLILGTAPSPASLAAGMYYSHPQNAFWRLLSDLTGDPCGKTPAEKTAFLLRHRIALWDTLQSCAREGSQDSAIRKPVPNDLQALLRRCPEIRAVFLNGGAACTFYGRFHKAGIALPYFQLPSSSPANARGGYAKKLETWKTLLPYLG